jgi:hypothetical protein
MTIFEHLYLLILPTCALIYNNFGLFENMMSIDPDVDAKLNTKTHLYTTFFIIMLFRARLASKFANSVT